MQCSAHSLRDAKSVLYLDIELTELTMIFMSGLASKKSKW